MTQLLGSRVLITGAGSGIGRLMALEIAQRGGLPILWDIDGASLGRLVCELNELGATEFSTAAVDISDRGQVEAAAAAALAAGPVDIIINNAGVVSGKALLELSDEEIEKTFGVNTLSLFWTTRAFLPSMIARKRGHIVTIASAAGTIGVSKLTDYSASKFAAFGFDESLRVELRQQASSIKTTIVCPYYIDTGMFKGVKTRFSALLPILDEEQVATKIIKAIEGDRARLYMPPLVYLVPLLRMLPPRLFDRIANILGINVSMDAFKGR